MGELTRNFDWSKTSIGKPDRWPQSLCTTVSIVLNSRFPMFLWWGEDLIQFYNDAYRPSLGKDGKHPKALGQKGEECWPEIWQVISPLIDEVRSGGEATWSEDQLVPIYRNGKLEDVYWTFSYSPVKEESGNVGGVLVVCTETTGHIMNRKRQEQKEAALQTMIMQAPAPMCVFRGPQFVIEIANNRMFEFWGKPEGEVMNKPLFEALPEARNQGYEELLMNVMTTGTPFLANEMMVTLLRNSAPQKVIVNFTYQPLSEPDGTVSGVLATVADITEQVLARKRIAESESRFKSMIDHATVAIGLTRGREMIIESINPPMMLLIHKTGSIVGKPLLQVLPELNGQAVLDVLYNVYDNHQTFKGIEIPTQLVIDGKMQQLYHNISYIPVVEEGMETGVLHIAIDVTEQVEARQKIEASENRFKKLVLQAPMGLCIIDAKTLVAENVNEQFVEVAGKPYETILGNYYWDTFAEAAPFYEAALKGVIDSGVTYYAKEAELMLMRHGKPEIVYATFVYDPIKDEAGNTQKIAIWVVDNTPQVKARQVVEESEHRFRVLIEQATVASCLFVGREMVIDIANETMLDYWGKGSSVLGKPLKEAVPELVGQPFLQLLDDVFTTGNTYDARNARADLEVKGVPGTYYFDFTYKALRNSDNEIYGVMDTAMDVTDKVVALKRIEESEANLRNTILQAPVAMCILKGADFVVEIANEKMFDIWGQGAENLLGKPIFDGLPNAKGQGFEASLKGVYTTGQTFKAFSVPITLPRNGQLENFYVDYAYEAYREKDGQISGIIAVVSDSTAKVVATQKIERSEAQFRLLADAMPQMVWTGAANGSFNYYNQAVYDYSGLTYEQLQKDGWMETVHPDEREENKRAWMQAIETGNDYGFQHRLAKKGGDYRWQLSRAVPQRDSRGVIHLWIGTSTDIHEQKLFEGELDKKVKERTEALENLNKELQRSNSHLEEFAHAASHDLKEPIRKIHIFTHRLKHQLSDKLSKEDERMFERVEHASHRMNSLIDDLLLYSHVSHQPHEKEPVDLNELLSRVQEDLDLDIQEKSAVITIKKLPVIRGYKRQLQQLFQNLIGNALKYSRTDMVPQIKITSAVVNGKEADLPGHTNYHVITVSDNGIGFEQGKAEKIFKMFQRLHTQTEYEGSGVGLSIVRKVAENHGGTIVAFGEPGEGASFKIYLPAVEIK